MSNANAKTVSNANGNTGSDVAELRVLTYNVRSLRDDVASLAAVVRSCRPDVVAVQEAPRFLRWRSKRAALARDCGLVVATADRPGGLLIMTSLRAAIVDTSFALLPVEGSNHRRAVTMATVEVGGTSWRIASIHLSTNADERRRHLEPLRSALRPGEGPPLLVAGDINEEPGGAVFDALGGWLQDVHAVAGSGSGATSPALAPNRRIDAIFADPSVTVVSVEVVTSSGVEKASDHLPVLAVLSQ